MPTTRITKASILREGIEFIADNDEPEEEDVEVVADFISVVCLAHVLHMEPIEVARKVIRRRETQWAAGEPHNQGPWYS